MSSRTKSNNGYYDGKRKFACGNCPLTYALFFTDLKSTYFDGNCEKSTGWYEYYFDCICGTRNEVEEELLKAITKKAKARLVSEVAAD